LFTYEFLVIDTKNSVKKWIFAGKKGIFFKVQKNIHFLNLEVEIKHLLLNFLSNRLPSAICYLLAMFSGSARRKSLLIPVLADLNASN
jgi:hypothetical protein